MFRLWEEVPRRRQFKKPRGTNNVGLNEVKVQLSIHKFISPYVQVTHLEKSTRRIFKCERCPQMCSRRSDLQKHVKVVHENQRNHSCTFCDKTCSTSGNLRRHVEARHSANRDKIHSCDKCDYVTHSKVYLAQHVRRHNPANRPECYFCRKKFCNFSRLVTHCRRHTLE